MTGDDSSIVTTVGGGASGITSTPLTTAAAGLANSQIVNHLDDASSTVAGMTDAMGQRVQQLKTNAKAAYNLFWDLHIEAINAARPDLGANLTYRTVASYTKGLNRHLSLLRIQTSEMEMWGVKDSSAQSGGSIYREWDDEMEAAITDVENRLIAAVDPISLHNRAVELAAASGEEVSEVLDRLQPGARLSTPATTSENTSSLQPPFLPPESTINLGSSSGEVTGNPVHNRNSRRYRELARSGPVVTFCLDTGTNVTKNQALALHQQ